MKKLLLVSFVFCFKAIGIYAQNEILEQRVSEQGVIKFAEFDIKVKKYALNSFEPEMKKMLVFRQSDELRFVESRKDNTDYEHKTYQQYFNGIKVEDAMYKVHAKKGIVISINGEFLKIESINTKPNLTEQEALKKALEQIGAKKYRWEIKQEENWIKSIKGADATFYPKGELMISQIDEKVNSFNLCYKFIINAIEPASYDYVYIDAQTGKILRKIPVMHNIAGTADTRYSGSQTIETQANNSSFRLNDVTRGGGIQTFNMRTAGASYANATEFIDNDNVWTASEFNNANFDNAALDVHWGIGKCYDYWSSVHQRNSYDGLGGAIRNYVHGDLALLQNNSNATNDNAFWDGNLRQMVYGDGVSLFNPVVSLDVTAHELGHGVAQTTAQFSINDLQARALNEGYSDIWGACVEANAAPAKQRWLIGEEIMRNGSPCLRNIATPLSGAYSLGADVYLGTNWSNSDPYPNSTVLSHCFFLLTEGATAQNSSNTLFKVVGIGIDKAAKIAFDAEKNLTSLSDFPAAQTQWLLSAKNLYGNCSAEHIATTNAWNAAGIGTATGPIVIKYQYGGSNIFYATSNTGITVSNSANIIYFDLPNYGPTSNYVWSVTNISGSVGQSLVDRNGYIILSSNSSCNVNCTVTNSCGTYSITFNCYNNSYSYRVVASPNPASDIITVNAVEVLDPKSKTANESDTEKLLVTEDINKIEFKLISELGKEVAIGKMIGGKVSFDIQKIPNGKYFLHVGEGDNLVIKQILIQH